MVKVRGNGVAGINKTSQSNLNESRSSFVFPERIELITLFVKCSADSSDSYDVHFSRSL